MFSRTAAPFCNWAALEPFPPMGREFVQALGKRLATLAKHRSRLDEALEAFTQRRKTPEFFRWHRERYLTYQQQGSEAALAHTLGRVKDDTNYAKVRKELGRADRALLWLAAKGVQDLYRASALAQLQSLLKSTKVLPVCRARHCDVQ